MNINNIGGTRNDISEMLAKIREVSNKSKVFGNANSIAASTQVSSGKSFEDVMSAAKDVLSNVNKLQTESEQVKNAYIGGDSNVSMSQVLLASQKSKMAFEGLVTVRNKILEAYKEIMNMPV